MSQTSTLTSPTPSAPPVSASALIPAASNTAPVEMFQGFDTFACTARSTAVSGTTGRRGTEAESRFQVCYDLDTLTRALKVSTSTSVSVLLGSVNAKADYLDNLNVTNTSVSIVVYSNKISKHVAATSVKLDVEAPSNTASDVGQFCQQYGDSYVSSLMAGGEYIATYVYYASTIDEQQQITATLTANGIGAGGSLSLDFQAKLDTVSRQISQRQEMKQFISGVSVPLPGPDKIVAFARDFVGLELTDPAIIEWSTETYNRAERMPATYESVIKNKRLFDGTPTRPGLAANYGTLRAVSDSISSISEIHEEYGYTGDAQLDANSDLVVQDLVTLESLFVDMSSHPTKVYSRPKLPGLALGQPKLNLTMRLMSTWGGDSGTPFDDIGFVNPRNMTKIRSVTVRGEAAVDRLTTVYIAAANADLDPIVKRHGGDGGRDGPTLTLQDGERITRVDGQYGSHNGWYVIQQLRFETSKGETMSWPRNPGPKDKNRSWLEKGDQRLFGFAGSAGDYLVALRLVVGVFSPSTWISYRRA